MISILSNGMYKEICVCVCVCVCVFSSDQLGVLQFN